jgi:Ca2+-binding RTX toxin-like protein
MNQRQTHPNSRIEATKPIHQLLLLTSTVIVVVIISTIVGQGQYIQGSLANQTTQSNNQTAAPVGNLRSGSFGEDRISGTNNEDIIIGLLGSDTINGGGGNDKIQGNEDSDKLYGDIGNDVLQGGMGSDQIYGRENDDVLVGGIDDDYLVGDEGNDQIYGSEGDDILIGNAGADYFDCGEGTDVIIDFNIAESDDNVGDCEEIIGSESIAVG